MASLLASVLSSLALAVAAPPEATYVVRLARPSPPAFVVTATWPGGSRLEMDTTRPGDLPELLERGWPALVTRLVVKEAQGRAIETTPDGAAGWRIPEGTAGPFSAEYEVDTRILAQNDWPAPREAAFMDGDVLSIVARSLFVTTDQMRRSRVRFELPSGWRPYAPWEAGREGMTFEAESVERLRENLVVFSRSAPVAVEEAGFRVTVFPLGSWRPLASEIRHAVRAQLRRFVTLMSFRGRESYVAVLLPIHDGGAESYRQSLAASFNMKPTRANQAGWANLLGHEIFHQWNGWRLRGTDYASTQWFQEGFTEYVANASTAAAGLMTPAELRDKLATHVSNYRRLATTLEAPGNKKGPPLYSAGSLVAFTWDVAIRDATGDRDLGDFLRALWRRSGGGERPYAREDIVAALEEIAPGDWTAFLDRHVRGKESLPLGETFRRAGLVLEEVAGLGVSVAEDPEASRKAKRIGRRIAAR